MRVGEGDEGKAARVIGNLVADYLHSPMLSSRSVK